MKDLSFDFMGRRKIATVVSILLILVAISALVFRGLNLGLDFTGGTLVEVEFADPVAPEAVRQELEAGS